MSPRIVLNLSQKEANGLFHLSIRDRRGPHDELRYLIVQEILRRHFLSQTLAMDDDIQPTVDASEKTQSEDKKSKTKDSGPNQK